MKIVGWFYLEGEPALAAELSTPIWIRVMVGEEGSTLRKYHSMYSVQIVTEAALRSLCSTDKDCRFLGPAVVINRLDTAEVTAALGRCIDEIMRFGIPIGITRRHGGGHPE